MRIFFVVLVTLHAAIHLLGFVKGFGFAPIAQLSLPISRLAGVAWLGAAAATFASAVLFVARWDPWWMVAVMAALGSQTLIVVSWTDAKAGTLANGVLLVAALLAFGEQRFSRSTTGHVAALLAGAESLPPGARPQAPLHPPALRRWLERSGALNAGTPRSVRLRQRGQMQLEPRGGFRDVVAQQYFRLDEPSFLWRVRLAMFGLPVVGRDTWIGGRGQMRIELAGLVPIVDESGERIDQGALLRYLGETVWFPAAALSPHIAWEEGADRELQARAVMSYEGVSATAEFTFDEDGRFSSLHADRYRGGGADAELTPWTVRATRWSKVASAGIEIPSHGEVVWHLPEGEFVFFRFEVTDIEYDVFTPYPPPP